MKFMLILLVIFEFGSGYVPIDVRRAFVENQIVPDVLTVAPKKIINVSDLWKTQKQFQI